MIRTTLTLLFGLGLAAAPAVVSATTIPYPNKSGTNVDFIDISETINLAGSDGVARFNEPNVSGDSLDFDPTSFDAKTTTAGGLDTTDVQLNFTVMAKPGKGFTNIVLTEAGDTTLGKAIGASGDAFTSVSTSIFIDILEVDGNPANLNLSVPMTFTPSGGDYQFSVDATNPFSFTTIWNGTANADLGAALLANNIRFTRGVTKATVALDNTLVATSSSGFNAFIIKKDADGIVIRVGGPDENEIPEPSTLVLAGLAAAGFCLRRRTA